MAEEDRQHLPPFIPYRPPGVVFIDEGTDGDDTGIIGRKRRADFRGAGVTVTDGDDRAIITIDGVGLGFCYDYQVDEGYTGTEGATFSVPQSTHTFKRYSTIQGAIDDIVSVDAKANYSVGVCNGDYVENVSWPVSVDVSTVEHISLFGMGGFYEPPGQATAGQVRIIPSSGAPLSYGSALPSNGQGGYFENIVFAATGAKAWDYLGGINATMVARDCFFSGGDVEAAGTALEFDRCQFLSGANLVVTGTGGTNALNLHHSWLTSVTIDMSGTSDDQGISITDNELTNTKIIIGGTQETKINDNRFFAFLNLNDVITVSSGSTSKPRAIIIGDNHFQGSAPSTGNGCIVIADTGGEQMIITITGNTFNGIASAPRDATTAWIKLIGDSGDKVFSCVVANNAFGSDTAQGNTLETRGGRTVLADYLEQSILGPNAPVGIVKYKVTNAANNLIIPPSADDNGPGDSGDIGINGSKIINAAGDTSVDTEENPDEKIVRVRTDGVERARWETNGDMQGNFIKMLDIGAAMVQASAPSTPADGQIWLDTSTSGTGTESLALITKTTGYTATDSDTVILCDAAAGALAITLPTAVGRTGKVFYVKKIDATANPVTVDGDGAETIDGATTQVISTQYNAIKIISGGSNWSIL